MAGDGYNGYTMVTYTGMVDINMVKQWLKQWLIFIQLKFIKICFVMVIENYEW